MSKQLLSRLSISLLLALTPALSGRASAAAVKSPKPAAASSKPGTKPGAKAVDPSTLPLDYAAVKSYYNDGDFGPAIDILEDFQKTHTTFAREESLTVYKYLGVMYCADQGTREKGKSYFYKLLKIDPQARILDMYVSIVVQDIFKSTLDELVNASDMPRDRTVVQGQASGGETFPMPRAQTGRPGKAATVEEKKSHTGYWLIGGLAVAAGIAGGYYLMTASADAPPDELIPVNPDK